MNQFKTKTGLLTPYALACGYIEQFEHEGNQVTLWNEVGPCFHVRQHDFKDHVRVFWDSFQTLGQARKRFAKAVKTITV